MGQGIMSADRGELNFDTWKRLLLNDCIAHNKVPAFNRVGEYVLKILYENGLDPTVEPS